MFSQWTCHTQLEDLWFLVELHWTAGILANLHKLVSWCFELSQPQRITSGLNINFTLSQSYSFHKCSYHKSHCCCFLAYLYSVGTQHRNLHLAGWPFLFCQPTQEPCLSHSQHRKNLERFWQKCRWMDRKCRNKQGRKTLGVSIACMGIHRPAPGFKGRTFKLCSHRMGL